MKVSIAMATYNGAKYILQQLESFANQSRLPDELVISDDCSTDETESIVHAFAGHAPFVVKFHRNKKNLGYCGNFNEALQKTTGDIVFLSDQDDVWFPEKIEHMLGVAEQHPDALVIMNDAALTDGELNEVGLTKLGQIRSSGLSIENFVMGCCCAIRRELLDLCIPIPAGVKAHDNWLVAFADGLSAKVIEPIVLQYYRRHDSNESQFIANSTKKLTRSKRLIYSLKNLINSNAHNAIEMQLEQMKIFADGVERSRKYAPDKYEESLIRIENSYREKISFTEKRLKIVNKPLLERFIYATFFLLNGRYQLANGYRSAIRDIWG